jgi:hypothetical protein
VQKHNLKQEEFETIAGELKQMKFLDILFHYPDGPRYDIALYLMGTRPANHVESSR